MNTSIVFLIIKRYWYIIVIAIMLVFLYLLYSAYQTALAKAERNAHNFAEQTTTPNKRIEVLTVKQFNTLKADLLDSIQTRIDKSIKAKQITSVTHLTQHFTDSSKTIYKTTNVPLQNGVFDVSYGDHCWGFDGYFNTNDSLMTINKKWFANETDIVVFWKRKRWFNSNKKFVPHWFGKKQTFIETYDLCNSKTNIVKTNIIKRD